MTTSWVWSYFEKKKEVPNRVSCKVCPRITEFVVLCIFQVCKDHGRDYSLAFNNNTTPMMSHLKAKHDITQFGPKGLCIKVMLSALHSFFSPQTNHAICGPQTVG